ncbi:hypothetical protein BGX31_005754 [Mortierella sp. GBA43]|nr:hypothetical protein BGX31_005754 [Mortierella sp. GBA43]
MQSGRALTPQPWHPDYSRSTTPNPLDLPEHRRNHSGDNHGLEEIDLDDRGEKNGPKLNKTRKNFFSKLTRSRTKKKYKFERLGKLAQFSNERLYLHWIRFGILQGSIAVTLLSFGLELASWIGVGSLVLAMITLIYATTLYHLRHLYMITKRDDIVYHQRTIPSLLAIALFLLYGSNFVLTMSIGDEARSPPPWTKNEEGFHLS